MKRKCIKYLLCLVSVRENVLFHFPKLVNQKTYLKVGCWFGVAATARGLVKKITEDVEEEEDGEQVQEGEEALVVVEGTVVCDHLAGEECEADDDQQDGVQTGAGYEQTCPET